MMCFAKTTSHLLYKIDKKVPDFPSVVQNQINTLIGLLNIQEIVLILGSRLFQKYMDEINKRYGKTGIGMLKSALKNNTQFIEVLKAKHENLLKAVYARYADRIEKSNKKKAERKQARTVNKLMAQRKKQTIGCLVKNTDPKLYEQCVTRPDPEDYKYASSILPRDSVADEQLYDFVKQGHEKQADAMLYEIYKKKSGVPLPPGKIRDMKANPNLMENQVFRKKKMEEIRGELEGEKAMKEKKPYLPEEDIAEFKNYLKDYDAEIKAEQGKEGEAATAIMQTVTKGGKEINELGKYDLLRTAAIYRLIATNADAWKFEKEKAIGLYKMVLDALKNKYGITLE